MSKTGYRRAGMAAIAAFFLFPGWALGGEPACSYSWVRIPNPGPGQYCVGTSINNLGTVAGYIASSGDTTRAFVWSPETDRVQLPLPPGVIDMKANAINDLGQVVGEMWGQTSGWQGFVWDGQEYAVIELPDWANSIEVKGVNSAGRVVGSVQNVNTGLIRGFLWSEGSMEVSKPPPGIVNARSLAVNEFEDIAVVGFWGPPARWQAFLSTDEGLSTLVTPAGFDTSEVTALTNNGIAAGSASVQPAATYLGVVWTPWNTNLVSPPAPFQQSRCLGINDAGRAVGFVSNNTGRRPIAWQSGSVTQLESLVNPAPPALDYSVAINSSGQILVQSRSAAAIVLTPSWLQGDLTGDCQVGLNDLIILLAHFGAAQGSYPLGDVNNDGQIDLHDITAMLAAWGD